jgi:hypothetical protein
VTDDPSDIKHHEPTEMDRAVEAFAHAYGKHEEGLGCWAVDWLTIRDIVQTWLNFQPFVAQAATDEAEATLAEERCDATERAKVRDLEAEVRDLEAERDDAYKTIRALIPGATEATRLRDGIETLAKEMDAVGENGWWWARKFRVLIAAPPLSDPS